MNRSLDITELAKALNSLQMEMPSVPMNAVNPFFNNSKYADLGSVIETSKPILGKHGFSISQTPTSKVEFEIPYVGLTTLLLHVSGQWIEDTIFIPLVEIQQSNAEQKENKKQANYPQKAGITISYLRRYGWVAILGMYGEEDTDGVADADLVIAKRKEIKNIFDSNPTLQEQYKIKMKDLGYNNETMDLKLIGKVITQLKEIQGEE